MTSKTTIWAPHGPQKLCIHAHSTAYLPCLDQAALHSHKLIHKGHVCAEILQGMYALPPADFLANIWLDPCTITLGLWKHQVFLDFAVKYTTCQDVLHLMQALSK